MCGRYFIDEDGLREYGFETAETGGADICPGVQAPALVMGSGDIDVKRMRWGFERPGGGLVINARAETMGERPMFRALSERQHCALPASRYYEWRRSDRQPFDISLEGASRFWLAGLYRLGAEGLQFVVLTQPPVRAILPVHSRMPLILADPGALRRWLDGETRLFDGTVRVQAHGPEQLAMPFA